MKKVIFGLYLGLNLLFAQEQYFIGVGLGHGDLNVNGDVTIDGSGTTNVSFKDGGGLVSIHGGIIINEKHKVFLEYTRYNSDNDAEMHQTGIGYEYYLNQILKLKNNKFSPYIGARYSVLNYKENLRSDSDIIWDNDEANLTYTSISLDIGFDYNIASNQFVEFTYSYELSSSQSNCTASGIYNRTKFVENIEINDLTKFIISYNYKF